MKRASKESKMRLSRLLSCVLLVAACGDNGSGTSGGKLVDAAHNDRDSSVPTDTSQPPGGDRIWGVGDVVDLETNLQNVVAVGFNDGDTLPFDGAHLPPFILPAGVDGDGTPVHKLFNAQNRAGVFDATKTKVAFIADLTTAGTFDIYVADADGKNPTLVVPATFATTLQSVQLSPDGTKIAFTADPDLATMFDTFIANTDGTGSPVQVTPKRAATAANLDAFFQGTWSADSKYFAFDANTDSAHAGIAIAYVVDTTVAAPAAVRLLADGVVTTGVGVRGQLFFDDQDRVYFRAQLLANVTNTLPQAYHLFVSDPDGGNAVMDPAFIPTRTDTTAAGVWAFAISPDGKTLAFGADAPTAGTYNVFAVATGSAGPATNLTNSTTPGVGPNAAGPSQFQPLWFAPDGKSVAFAANYSEPPTMSATQPPTFSPGDFEPFVAKTDGSGMTRLVDVNASVTGGCTTNCDVNGMQWTSDGKSIYAIGDIVVPNDTFMYKLNPATANQTPTAAVNVVTTRGDFSSVIIAH